MIRAAAPIFPYPDHRTMAAVMADEARVQAYERKRQDERRSARASAPRASA